ncbi:MAG TPA: hypothetical protein VGS10_01480 [Terracidiphilus sp.]|nr:hypothetical protein [Terracidiphilus sp.]
MALAAQAKVLPASKLEQLVNRIQRHSGRPKEACWRLVIQYGIKGRQDHRRWSESEFDILREELERCSVEQVAKLINRTPKAVRNMLRRNDLTLGEIRSDQHSVYSLASAVHVRKAEVVFWIEQKWLRASVVHEGKRRRYIITAEALKDFLRHHRDDLIRRGIRNLWQFEAYLEFCYVPKHTTGEQILDVRHDKKERAAFEKAQRREDAIDEKGEEDEDFEDDLEERYGIAMAEVNDDEH